MNGLRKDIIIKSAVKKFGNLSQIEMAKEECAELIVALEHLRRGRVGEDAIITEIADVQIMMDQLAFIFGPDKVEAERDRKLVRLEERLKTFGKGW